jgi:uncharacterized membrane protein YbhN (UPF0104 family)/tRNA A-37 threonylcarbamoyl transferase component Bud32
MAASGQSGRDGENPPRSTSAVVPAVDDVTGSDPPPVEFATTEFVDWGSDPPGPVRPKGARRKGEASPLVLRWRELRVGSFGRADEEPYRRRTSDWFRLIVGAAALIALCTHAGHPSRSEADLVRFVNQLPSGLGGALRVLNRIGSLWAVGLVMAAALIARRGRLARDLVLAGVLAWATSRLLGLLIVQREGLGHSLRLVTHFGSDTPNFPVTRLAVVVAVVAVAGPYLGRPSRRIGRVLVILLAFASMYLVPAYPTDILGALALGWGIAAAIHLGFGSPGGRPTPLQMRAALAELGVRARDVRLANPQPIGATLMLAESDRGPLWVKVLGRDEVDAQFLAKAYRWVLFKDSGPALSLTRRHQLEHEAYVALLASANGLRVAEVFTAAVAGPKAALLVMHRLTGPPLRVLKPEELSDALLDATWQQIASLHRIHISHGALNAAHVIVTPTGPALVGFEASTTNASPTRLAVDVAEFLASSAAIVGAERAVASAMRIMGPDAVTEALPLLQPAVLTAWTRRRSGSGRKAVRLSLTAVRETAAAALGMDAPELQKLARMTRTNLLMAIGTFIAVFALLAQVGNPSEVWEAIRSAHFMALLGAFGIVLATNIGYALGLQGTTAVRLPFAANVEVQLGTSFASVAVPGLGGPAMQIRFLQKEGVDLASAVAAGGILSLAGNVVAQVGLFLLALLLSPNHINLGHVSANGVVAVIISVVLFVGLICLIAFGIPALRRRTWPPMHKALGNLWEALRSPRRVALLIGGNALAAFLLGCCLAVCLSAFDGHLAFWTVMAIAVGIGGLSQLIPIPGGGTAVASVGISGVMIALGVDRSTAVATALANQIVSMYLPAFPGWFATRHLVKHDHL